MMQYTNYNYLFPPRPENAIKPELLNFYEKMGYIGQQKYNGTCTVIFSNPKETIYKQRRFDEDHRMWKSNKDQDAFFQSLCSDWCVFVAELLHSKTPHIKNTLYIHEILVLNGTYLTGTTWFSRQQILDKMLPGSSNNSEFQTEIAPTIWRAANHHSDFLNKFNSMTDDAYEGWVLKNPNSILSPCFKADNNRSWQVKCRKPTKNYGF